MRLVAVAVVTGSVVLLAQQPRVFRTSTDVVQLDVSVLDKKRRPVRGLTAADFTVLEDGQPRRIVGFSTVDLAGAAEPAVGWMRDVPKDVATNQVAERRLIVLLIDDVWIPQDPYFIQSSRRIAADIIDRLQPTDLATVVFTGDHRRSQEFTNDRARLRAALVGFNPGLAGYRFGLETAGVDADWAFYHGTINTLRNIVETLADVSNQRKVIFWISPGVPIDINNCQPSDPRGSGVPLCVAGGRLSQPMLELTQRLDEVQRLAQRANVVFYPVDPGGLDGITGFLIGRLGVVNKHVAAHKLNMQHDVLASTATNTGGRTVMNVNDFGPGIGEIFEENEVYYLIGFEPGGTGADGRLHRIQVQVNHRDVAVRTRSGYYARQPEPRGGRNTSASPEAEALAKAISGSIPDAGLPLRAVVTPVVVPGQRLVSVCVVLGVSQPIPPAAAKERLTETTELQTSAFTPAGQARGVQRHTARITIRPGSDGLASYEVLGRIDLPPGSYRLRLAAHNRTTNKTGSVFADVEVPDYADAALSAAPIVLGAQPGRVSAPRDLFAKLLPFVPTAEREFVRSDKVTALLRLYQSGRKPVVPTQVHISVRAPDDRVLVAEQRAIPAADFVSAGEVLLGQSALPDPKVINPRLGSSTTKPTELTKDAFANLTLATADVTFTLPFDKLLVGQYLLSFEVTSKEASVRRDLRFSVR